MKPRVSVVVSAHNPHPQRLRRTLEGLSAQTCPGTQWELVLVDNASNPSIAPAVLDVAHLANARLVREDRLGLTYGRRRGLHEARGDFCVLVDDDNVLGPDYLSEVARLFEAHPQVGAMGGKSMPDYERPPAPWVAEFSPLLALRDLGETPRISGASPPSGAAQISYPADCAPIGAGMALRRESIARWMAPEFEGMTDRRGAELTSGGDNELVLAILEAGWKVAYFPTLVLTHVIPASRLDARYLARLNRGIQKSWMQVLARHRANPWPAIPAWTVPLRNAKAWFTARGWSWPSGYIRWQGICGHFEGRVEGA